MTFPKNFWEFSAKLSKVYGKVFAPYRKGIIYKSLEFSEKRSLAERFFAPKTISLWGKNNIL